MKTDLLLETILKVIECIKTKKASGRVRRLRRDVERFATAASKGDADQVNRLIEEVTSP